MKPVLVSRPTPTLLATTRPTPDHSPRRGDGREAGRELVSMGGVSGASTSRRKQVVFDSGVRHTSSLKLALLLLPTMVAVAESQPAEFGPQAKTLLRVVACGGEVSTPAAAETAPIVSRCAVLREAMDLYRRRWLRRATPLLASASC